MSLCNDSTPKDQLHNNITMVSYICPLLLLSVQGSQIYQTTCSIWMQQYKQTMPFSHIVTVQASQVTHYISYKWGISNTINDFVMWWIYCLKSYTSKESTKSPFNLSWNINEIKFKYLSTTFNSKSMNISITYHII